MVLVIDIYDKAFHKFNSQNLWFAHSLFIDYYYKAAISHRVLFPTYGKHMFPSIGFLNLSAGLITTISQFLRVSELLEGHRAASLAYSKFSKILVLNLVCLLRKELLMALNSSTHVEQN